ncbi:NicO-domain-containing protein [Coprinopsis sp. MPI-PUGE-AT-0042]|nr:NicO-domain-containing protein [Coprinopsis sp. MPI-PUGE-AT-0042]
MAFSLTIFGRSVLLIATELLANAICWAIAAILFASKAENRPILSMALLAWTLGLRHALDADHISAIDNATRALINRGQLPVTCGLFFSLGHSTIVIVVTIAIAISVNVYDNLGGVSTVGGIVGASVAGSFLFIVGVANSVIPYRVLRRRRKQKRLEKTDPVAAAEAALEDGKREGMLMMRIIGPVINFVNRPWKMYPVGVLFGFGFDTASSIGLISVSTIAKRQVDGASFPASHIIILPLLFTAGMTLLDSVDSIIMLYSYTAFPEHSWRLFERKPQTPNIEGPPQAALEVGDTKTSEKVEAADVEKVAIEAGTVNQENPNSAVVIRAKTNVMSSLSIALTILSILLAFTIALITIISLIGENCSQCVAAAESEDGGGLAGSWWRGWANAAEQSGWIGIGIVGGFVMIVGGYYFVRWLLRRQHARNFLPASQEP